jgi:hypothetical protein
MSDTSARLDLGEQIIDALEPVCNGQPTALLIEACCGALIALLAACGASHADAALILRSYATAILARIDDAE